MSTVSLQPDRRISGPWPWVVLAGFIVLCLAAGWLGSIATIPNIPTWYAGLNKPWFSPPNWVFAPVWTTLYVLMGISAWLIWRAPERRDNAPFVPFAIQLALNVSWSFAFFGAHSPLAGLVVIVVLWVVLVWNIATFWPISRAAAWLLIPYLAWITFATALNGGVYALN